MIPREHRTPDGRTVLLRHAEEGDAAAVLDYFARVGGETANLSFGAEGPTANEEQERGHIARMRRADNAIFVVGECGGRIVATLTFEGGAKARTRHTGELGISVGRELWGQGVGRALMDELLEWSAASGVVRKLNLRVRTDNARAIRLYERLGFREEGRATRDLLVDGEFHDSLWMGLEIDPPPEGGRASRTEGSSR
jgi:RimJ/RimL family protein N-acetyltransferase